MDNYCGESFHTVMIHVARPTSLLSTAESYCFLKLISKADIAKQNLAEIVNLSFPGSKTANTLIELGKLQLCSQTKEHLIYFTHIIF